MTPLKIIDLFKLENLDKELQIEFSTRLTLEINSAKIILDKFKEAESIFIYTKQKEIEIILDHPYTIEKIDLGGYLAKPKNSVGKVLWIPIIPKQFKLNSQQQILDEKPAELISISWQKENGSITFSAQTDTEFYFVIWRFPFSIIDAGLLTLNSIESQQYFLWGSHAYVSKPSDLYRHLIFGSVYDLRYSWPQNKRCFSENEAHALYTIYSGLEKSTGKSIYRCFQLQLVLSVIHRQSDDGGWYHGMWTDDAECHYRLHTSGIHMLLDEYTRSKCPTVKIALEKAVNFLSKTTDQLVCGAWFLHDSLELTEAAMNKGPFRWIANKTLGKRVSNMLVLNTHLDSTIAINRYAKLTGDSQYDELIASALHSTRTVLSLKPAEWLYKPLFWAIGLTMLPTETAKRLPLPIRAIKRIASEYLIKMLPDIKARFPRLVMPNGYIDRELSLRTWAIDYQTINLMDLCRYARAFPGQLDDSILEKALEFTQTSGLIKRYQELPSGKQYAPGFWVEALYYRCLSKPDMKYRQWLAEGIIQNKVSGLGFSPSLMGTNGEAVPFEKQIQLAEINNPWISIANLSYDEAIEYLLINLSEQEVTISSLDSAINKLNWTDSLGNYMDSKNLKIQASNWIIGKNTTALYRGIN